LGDELEIEEAMKQAPSLHRPWFFQPENYAKLIFKQTVVIFYVRSSGEIVVQILIFLVL